MRISLMAGCMQSERVIRVLSSACTMMLLRLTNPLGISQLHLVLHRLGLTHDKIEEPKKLF